MQQTLFALLALLIATFLSYNQKQATVQNQVQVVQAEMEQMALGVAAQSVQVIRARAYDAVTAGVPSDSLVPTSAFTDPPFSTGNDCRAFGGSSTCDDVDDFHEMESATVPFSFPSGTFEFTVDVEIRYVDEDLEPAGSQTDRKQILVEVQDDPGSGKSPRLSEPIQYSEVVSYP
jgi:hypothetical protein